MKEGPCLQGAPAGKRQLLIALLLKGVCERENGERRETEHVHMHARITALGRQLGGSISSLLPCEASPQSKTDVKGGKC